MLQFFYSQWGPDGIRDKEFTTSHYLHGAWDGVQRVPAGKEEYHLQFRGTISNIVFKDIQVYDHLPFSVFYGYDKEHMVKNVLIEDLYHKGRKLKLADAKIRVTNTEGLVVK